MPDAASNAIMIDVSLIIAAYLLGSISSAIVVCRLMGLPDPRTQGSNNPGATNVLRFGGKKAAAVTLVGDSLKGFLPVAACHLLERPDSVFALAGAAAFLGHLYPLFFQFKGGKGVATALGVQFGLSWAIGGLVGVTWLLMARIGNISSLAALISMALAPLFIWLLWPSPALVVMQIGITLLLFWRHRSNIQNLLRGTEGRIADNEDR